MSIAMLGTVGAGIGTFLGYAKDISIGQIRGYACTGGAGLILMGLAKDFFREVRPNIGPVIEGILVTGMASVAFTAAFISSKGAWEQLAESCKAKESWACSIGEMSQAAVGGISGILTVYVICRVVEYIFKQKPEASKPIEDPIVLIMGATSLVSVGGGIVTTVLESSCSWRNIDCHWVYRLFWIYCL